MKFSEFSATWIFTFALPILLVGSLWTRPIGPERSRAADGEQGPLESPFGPDGGGL